MYTAVFTSQTKFSKTHISVSQSSTQLPALVFLHAQHTGIERCFYSDNQQTYFHAFEGYTKEA